MAPGLAPARWWVVAAAATLGLVLGSSLAGLRLVSLAGCPPPPSRGRARVAGAAST